ncbi:transposase [Halomonas piscis]|uniref:transposase n=1 Tax=Halomonas piscis TaxID=3031727 RepID=UPI00389934D3
MSRKKKGSVNRDEAKLKVARIHAKIVGQRQDFAHKVTKRLIAGSYISRRVLRASLRVLIISGFSLLSCLPRFVPCDPPTPLPPGPALFGSAGGFLLSACCASPLWPLPRPARST